MNWADVVSTVVGAAGGGGLFGIVGGWLKMRENIECMRLQNEDKQFEREHEQKMQDGQLEAMRLEAANKLDISRVETSRDLQLSLDKVQSAIYDHAKLDVARESDISNSLFLLIVEGWRRAIRPLCTTISLGVIVGLSLWATSLYKAYGGALSAEQSHELFMYLLTTVCFISVTCITFWFVARPPEQMRIK